MLCGDRRGNRGRGARLGQRHPERDGLSPARAWPSLVFAAVNFLPYGWRALYVIGAVPLFLVAFLRRRLPETKRFAAQEDVRRQNPKSPRPGRCCSDMVAAISRRASPTILIAAAAFGFAISPATLLASEISADRLSLPALADDGAVHSRRAGRAGAGHRWRDGCRDRLGPQARGVRHRRAGGHLLSLCSIAARPAGRCRRSGSWPSSASSAGDALVAGFALEIVPTHYRATVSGLRYLVEISAGALAWRWKAVFTTISTPMARDPDCCWPPFRLP